MQANTPRCNLVYRILRYALLPKYAFLIECHKQSEKIAHLSRQMDQICSCGNIDSCYIKCVDHISCYFSAHHTVNYRHAHLMLLSSKFHTTLGNCSKCDTQTGGLPLLENSEVCTEICKLSLLSKYTRSPL
jgi:hypothetical protein